MLDYWTNRGDVLWEMPQEHRDVTASPSCESSAVTTTAPILWAKPTSELLQDIPRAVGKGHSPWTPPVPPFPPSPGQFPGRGTEPVPAGTVCRGLLPKCLKVWQTVCSSSRDQHISRIKPNVLDGNNALNKDSFFSPMHKGPFFSKL